MLTRVHFVAIVRNRMGDECNWVGAIRRRVIDFKTLLEVFSFKEYVVKCPQTGVMVSIPFVMGMSSFKNC